MQRGNSGPADVGRVMVGVELAREPAPLPAKVGQRAHGIRVMPELEYPPVGGLVIDPAGRDSPATSMLRKLGRRQEHRVPMSVDDRRAIIMALYHEGPAFGAFARRFTTLMVLSVLIAVFGLVADSTAVVIGAMLVAPLLTPVLGLSAAVVMGWPGRVLRHSVVVALAASGAITLAGGIGFVLPFDLDPLPAELLARTAPNLLDLGVAVGAGAAGAFAIVRRQAADAMSGAAVAVALVPPLSAVGILLRAGEPQLATGAGMLFLINVAGVVVAGSLVFIATGFVPGVQLVFGARRTLGRLRWVALATVALVFLLQGGNSSVIQTTPAFEDIEGIVDHWTNRVSPTSEVVDLTMDVEDGAARITAVVATTGQPPPVDELATELANSLDQPVNLELRTIPAQSARASATRDASD